MTEENQNTNASGEVDNITAAAVSSGASGVDTSCGDENSNGSAGNNGHLARIRLLLGCSAVLLPIPTGQKRPQHSGWQNTTLEDMANPEYLARLSTGNIDVLLGKPSGDLCTIDIDGDAQVAPFLQLNPNLSSILRSKGARGEQIWIRVAGEYPKLTPIKAVDGSILVSGAPMADNPSYTAPIQLAANIAL
ncbi:MAG: hypothetical protein ACFUZC_21305 [Chthoniobacteraceae bacterium]